MSDLEKILRQIARHFRTKEAKQRIRRLAEDDRQTEAWFKLELMLAFWRLSNRSEIQDRSVISRLKSLFCARWRTFEGLDSYAEVRNEDNKLLDFVLLWNGKTTGLEVKACFVGRQYTRTLIQTEQGNIVERTGGETPLTLSGHYLTGSGFAVEDVKKLIRSQLLQERLFLAFAYGKNEYLNNDHIQRFSGGLNELTEDSWTVVPIRLNGRIDLGQNSRLEILAYSIEKTGL